MQRVKCYLPGVSAWGLPSQRQNAGRERFPSSSAVGLCCRVLAKHSSLTEPFGVELPETDPQNLETGWISLQWRSPSSKPLLLLEAAVMDLGAA